MHIEIHIKAVLRTCRYDIIDDINIPIGSLWLNWSHQVGIFMEYMCHKWLRTCSVRRNHNPFLSSFMIYQRVCHKSKKSGVTCGFSGVRVAGSLVSVVVCRSLFVFLSFVFLLAIILTVLRFVVSILQLHVQSKKRRNVHLYAYKKKLTNWIYKIIEMHCWLLIICFNWRWHIMQFQN